MTSARFDISVPRHLALALQALETAGHEAWCAGPCVRDMLLGRRPHNAQVMTSAPTASIANALKSAGFGDMKDDGAGGITTAMGGQPLSVAPYRILGMRTQDHALVCTGFADSAEEDLGHRGFTVNALAFHPRRGVLDCCGGLDDLQSSTLRTTGDASDRFSENGLLVLQGCRLASQLGLTIEADTLRTMVSHKMRLAPLPASLIVPELDALLLGDHVHDTLVQCIDVLVAIMPELAACKEFDQRTPYHVYDVWEHTAWVVQRSPSTRLARWAALFHDIGKPAACFMEGSRAHFFGHAKLSALMARGIMERLELPADFIERVLVLVRIHDETIAADERSVRRACENVRGDVELLQTLCAIKRADALAQSDLAKPRLRLAESLAQLVQELYG